MEFYNQFMDRFEDISKEKIPANSKANVLSLKPSKADILG